MTARLASPKDVGARGTMNPERAAQIAAKRIGVPLDVYLRERASGKRWCSGCHLFHPEDEFSGRNKLCREAKNLATRMRYNAPSPRVAVKGARGRPPTCTLDEVLPLFAAGHRISAIARTLGSSYWAVRRELVDRGATRDLARTAEIKRSHSNRRFVIARQSPFSLDAPVTEKGGADWYEIQRLPSMLSAEDELLRDESALMLRQIVGDLTPEDVQRMTTWDIDRLRERLAVAGFAPEGVQESERDRLRAPNRHAGALVVKSRGHGGGKRSRKAQQRVTRDHHVREMTDAQKQAHKQLREVRRAA